MIFFFTKPWDVHHFSCTTQVFLLLLHTALSQHVQAVLVSQEPHTKHSENLLPTRTHLLTLVEVCQLCRAQSNFVSLHLIEIGMEILEVDLMVLTIELQFFLGVGHDHFLQDDCIDIGKYVLIVLIFIWISSLFYLLFAFQFRLLSPFFNFGSSSDSR
jgi:hypothetical protein